MREGQYQNPSFRSSPDEMLAAKQMQKEVTLLFPEVSHQPFYVRAQINRLREEGFKKMKEQEEWLRQQLLSGAYIKVGV